MTSILGFISWVSLGLFSSVDFPNSVRTVCGETLKREQELLAMCSFTFDRFAWHSLVRNVSKDVAF